MLPQVEWANQKGYPVMVMNPNHESTLSSNDHVGRVWFNYVKDSGFTKLLVIAHSAGGGSLNMVLNHEQLKRSFTEQV